MELPLGMIVGALAVLLLIVVSIPPVLRLWLAARRRAAYRAAPLQRLEARIVDKRTQLTTGRDAQQLYFVTFQFPSGDRLELAVPGAEAGVLVVGDEGLVSFKSTRYLGFEREILR